MSFIIIGCTTISPVTNTVDLTSTDFSNAKNFKEAKACEFFFIGFIGPFGNAQIIKAIQENSIKKVYAVDRYYANYIFVQKRCVFVYGEEMTNLEKIELSKKNSKRKKKKGEPKKKNDDKPWYSDLFFWELILFFPRKMKN